MGRSVEALRHLMEGADMVFQYEPEQASNAWPVGSYEATIEKVEESISKAQGDPMLIVSYRVYGAPGGPTRGKTLEMKDYITAPPADSGRKGSLFKLKAIAEVLGLADKFKTKALRPKQDLVGKNLIVNLTVRESAQYGDQNQVDSYAKLDRAPQVPVEEDEEVPF